MTDLRHTDREPGPDPDELDADASSEPVRGAAVDVVQGPVGFARLREPAEIVEENADDIELEVESRRVDR